MQYSNTKIIKLVVILKFRSLGLNPKNTEHSIYNAYIDLIRNSEHYIYIEN